MLHISSLPKTSCCGCSACSLSCPLQLISMTPDAEGFLYPKIQNPEQCIHCGKCVKLCPLNNITLKDGRPLWGNQCTHCMACIGNCPTRAIEYGTITRSKIPYNFGKYRYVVIGGDDTLFALIDGVVKYERKDKKRKQVSVYPVEA